MTSTYITHVPPTSFATTITVDVLGINAGIGPPDHSWA
jgi:hypothetical protein